MFILSPKKTKNPLLLLLGTRDLSLLRYHPDWLIKPTRSIYLHTCSLYNGWRSRQALLVSFRPALISPFSEASPTAIAPSAALCERKFPRLLFLISGFSLVKGNFTTIKSICQHFFYFQFRISYLSLSSFIC